MTIIHNKVEPEYSSVDAGISTATSAVASATAAVSTATSCITSAIATMGTITAGTITGTATYPGTIYSSIGGPGDRIIRLDSKISDEQAFRLPWGKVASVSHEELIKYIGERDLRESNELVRTLWDRYQTAVKLIWSEDDEQEK